jgi:glutathione-regulated potassium-efflux system ancillary protein KefG
MKRQITFHAKKNLNPVFTSIVRETHANKALVNHIPDSENITFHDLYEQYPNFDIDVKFRTRFIEQT